MTPELEAASKQADSDLEGMQVELRNAQRALNRIGELASTIQRHASDAEFTVDPDCRSHLDANLLQRTGFVNTVSAELAGRMRLLSQGLRDLRSDCVAIHTGEFKKRIEDAKVRVESRT